MSIVHDFELNATPEMAALAKFIQERLSTPAELAAGQQPSFEVELRKHMLSVERAVHAVDLARFDVDVQGIVTPDARFRRRGEKSTGIYETMAGPVSVLRTTYRRRGGHGGETIVPLEMRLGLVDGRWTLAAAETASAFMASVPSKEAAMLLKAAGTMAPSASSLDRLPKLVSEVWEADREQFEADVREASRHDLPDPEAVAAVVLSLDGVMVRMKDAPRIPGLKKADQGPKGHKEAGCATVTLYGTDGARLKTIRFARMPEKHKRTLHQQLQEEARAMFSQYPDAERQSVADGAHDGWRILGEIADELGEKMRETLDFYHAAGHLNDGLTAAGLSKEAVKSWCHTLKHDPEGLDEVVEELGRLFMECKKAPVEKVFNYFLNNAGRVDYAQLASDNLPIGSGVQEAACKSLVSTRMKRSGQSWREPGGQAVLTLRSLAQSERLGHAWKVLAPAFVKPFEIDPSQRRQLPTRLAA